MADNSNPPYPYILPATSILLVDHLTRTVHKLRCASLFVSREDECLQQFLMAKGLDAFTAQ